MNLAIDIGNTAIKWATFEAGRMTGNGRWHVEKEEWNEDGSEKKTGRLEKVEQVLLCASGNVPSGLRTMLDTRFAMPDSPCAILDSNTPLPIGLDYRTPATLGPDRVAAACGAWALHPGEDCLIVDAGTCITVDFLSADGIYHGGAIMPGLQMNLQALHTFTAKLPLISLDGIHKAPVLGRSTEESILAGTLGATMLALAGYVALYRQRCPQLRVLLTGGDARRLLDAGADAWEHTPLLTLQGLDAIMTHNKQ